MLNMVNKRLLEIDAQPIWVLPCGHEYCPIWCILHTLPLAHCRNACGASKSKV